MLSKNWRLGNEVNLLFCFKEIKIYELPQVAKLYNKLAFELNETINDLYFDFETLSQEVITWKPVLLTKI